MPSVYSKSSEFWGRLTCFFLSLRLGHFFLSFLLFPLVSFFFFFVRSDARHRTKQFVLLFFFHVRWSTALGEGGTPFRQCCSSMTAHISEAQAFHVVSESLISCLERFLFVTVIFYCCPLFFFFLLFSHFHFFFL